MKTLLYFTLLLLISCPRVMACAACYGNNSGSKMGDAATWGVAAMVVIMFGVLAAISGFFYYLSYRAKHPLPDYEHLLSEDEPEQPLPDAS